ncbi:cell division cycle protein 16 homolog isoform X2 [Cimex lectularius]|uniref:Cell division cycle protein 16 homolog n=1 Tax=Cimex lectularius TaxID=79782 RepID=A0A8I6TLU2_CIMLE|nr:cell division cycle protein 16 homolog isoform X2 [Cimex lectularius]
MGLTKQMYSSALFWADKVVSLSDGEPRDVYWLAQCMYLLKQYHRAALLIKNRQLEKTHLICRYLAAKCLLEAKEFKDALALLNGEDGNNGNMLIGGTMTSILELPDTPLEGFSTINLHSAILYLKGCVYEALDNRSLASECYKQALRCDIHCYDAFQALVQHQMLTSWEEKELISTLPFAAQCKTKDEEWLVRSLYDSLLKKYQNVPSRAIIQVHPKLEGNLDLEVAKAERHYYACAYSECFLTTQLVLDKDPYHMSCLPIHIACLVELKKGNALFYLAHDLVDRHPDLAVSWFAVGCYYYLKGNTDPARRYLGKATSLDRVFGPAWLVYGHSFAVENEHDQAMAAYFKASQLMKGCHLPLLYIGLECGLTNNIKLAEKFFLQAQTIAPKDPFVIHEMGVVAYQNNDYVAAEKYFEEALSRVKEIDDVIIADKWESLFNNLGHTCRKLKKYDKSLVYHKKALVLAPLSPSTLASIGFVQALVGQTSEAAESFHKALSLRRDDTFSTSMLTFIMEQLVAEAPPFEGEEVPVEFHSFGKRNKPDESEVSIRTPPSSNSPQIAHTNDEMDMQDSFQDENNT